MRGRQSGRKGGERVNRKAIFIFVRNMMYSIFTCGFDDDCLCAATLSDGDTACAQGSRVITYDHSGAKGQMDGSIFFSF